MFYLFALVLSVSQNQNYYKCNHSSGSFSALPYIDQYERFLVRVHNPLKADLHIATPGVLCEPTFESNVPIQQRVIFAQAFRQLQLMLPRDTSDCHRLHVTTANYNVDNILAEAWPGNTSGPNLRFYPVSFEANLFFLVAQHEMLHMVGFNGQANGFYSRINTLTDSYTSQVVSDCLTKYENAGSSYSIGVHKYKNEYTMHWSENQYFDLMTPYVSGNSNLHPCTLAAAAEASPFASTPNICLTTEDCLFENDYNCVQTTPTNPSVCLPIGNKTILTGQPIQHKFPVFTTFFVTLFILLKQLLVCSSIHNTPCSKELRGE